MIKVADNHLLAESVVDGPGLRAVLFVQGCPMQCDGCHNPSTWSYDNGKWMPVSWLIKEILDTLTPLHQGLTLSGGEPMMQYQYLDRIIKAIRQERPDINFMVYTGMDFDELLKVFGKGGFDFLNQVDYLKTGAFQKAERDINLMYRGSKNQQLWKKVQNNRWEIYEPIEG